MFAKFDTFEERSNKFFNAMLLDLNPKIYAISTDRFVFQEKQTTMTGQVNLPNANVVIYINGVIFTSALADGDGKFTTSVRLVNDENDIIVDYT